MFKKTFDKQTKILFSILISILAVMTIAIILLVMNRTTEQKIFVTFFYADIISNDTSTIVVDGFNDNPEDLRDTYQIHYSDDIKIIDSDGNDIPFTDVKKGGAAEIKFVQYKDIKSNEPLTLVLKIQYFESIDMLYKNRL